VLRPACLTVQYPTPAPTEEPTATPTASPTELPTASPTVEPTAYPTPAPTAVSTGLLVVRKGPLSHTPTVHCGLAVSHREPDRRAHGQPYGGPDRRAHRDPHGLPDGRAHGSPDGCKCAACKPWPMVLSSSHAPCWQYPTATPTDEPTATPTAAPTEEPTAVSRQDQAGPDDRAAILLVYDVP
jgi:hypothetical protein